MHTTTPLKLTALALAVGLATPMTTLAQAGAAEEILITGVRDNRVSRGATGLSLEIRETPQSISVVDAELMQDFGANNINDALSLATGVQVERWETNRTNFLSRGFEIKSTQIDGIGMPNNWGLVTGAIDTFGYEKIEVIRGANGLLTGVGSASGTINYVRKRPTNDTRGSLNLMAGSWDRMRLEADYSTPLTDDGNWAGRIVVAAEDADSYLRGMENDRTFVYGVVDGQLTRNSTLAAGYSHQKADTVGNMWGALVFTNADGSQAEWDTGASTTQDWAYWDTTNETAFLEYNYVLPNDWTVEASWNYRNEEETSELFFAYTTTGLDPDTGAGLVGWPGKWPAETESNLFDLNLRGDYALFGGQHEFLLGVNRGLLENTQYQHPADASEPAFGLLPPFPYAGDAIPEPAWGAKIVDSELEDDMLRVYGATRLRFGAFAAILGFNATSFERDSTAQATVQDESELSPYLGLSYDIGENVMAYASYSDIYQPQDYYDVTGAYLDPTKGVNYELGAKAEWLDSRLLTTVAVFQAEQQGLGTYAGLNPDTGQYFYTGEDVNSEGFEIEATGAINEYVNVIVGFTSLELEDELGNDTYTWVPGETFNFAINASLPWLTGVSVGLGGKWQDDISKIDGYTGIEVNQESYLLLNGFARWNIDEHSQLQLNVNNLSDEKYITSLYEIGYYGAPRNAQVSYRYSF